MLGYAEGTTFLQYIIYFIVFSACGISKATLIAGNFDFDLIKMNPSDNKKRSISNFASS